LVLFMARLWDADKVKSTEARQEREELNQMRAKCVELLKKEFGKYFLGGLAPTAYAQKYYPQQVLENELLTRKDNYLKIMHGTSICIATTGLAGSVGWKMAEYIAGAKAIISQKIIYEYPGEFRENVNYLPFVTAEECVEKAVWLFKNPERRFQIMQANQQYYLEYIQPDKMILNSLRKVLDHKK